MEASYIRLHKGVEMKYYYDDALQATWMMLHFDMKYIAVDGAEVGVVIDYDYLHPDSYEILKPQVGDIMATVRPDSTSTEFLVSDMRAKEYEHLMCKEYPAKIIQRQGKAFFTPLEMD